MTQSIQKQQRFWERIRMVGIIFFALLILIPLLYIILMSITPNSEIGGGSTIPNHLTLENYVHMWTTIRLGRELGNSVLIAGCTGFFSSILALGAAYIAARFKFFGRRIFTYSLIAMQNIPQVMLLLPFFIILSIIQRAISVHIIGSYYILILTYMTFGLPISCWLLLSYMANIPVELEESAMIDGCTRYQVVRHVVFPLMLPGMIVAFVFAFLICWNDVLFASVLTTEKTRTIAVGLQAFVASSSQSGVSYWGQLMAASITSSVPIVVIYLFLQKYIMGGLTHGAVKG